MLVFLAVLNPYLPESFQKEFSTQPLPLTYRWRSSRPQPLMDCDTEAYQHPPQATIQRLSCGHTFHSLCMSQGCGNNLGCTICLYRQLISDIKRLSESWNKGLLSGIDKDHGDDCEENHDNDHDDDDADDKSPKLEMPKERDQMYFKSPLFVKNIQRKLTRSRQLLMQNQY